MGNSSIDTRVPQVIFAPSNAGPAAAEHASNSSLLPDYLTISTDID